MDVIAGLRRFTRSRRGDLFRSYIAGMRRPLTIVDLGGTVRFWEAWGFDKEEGISITLINNHKYDTTNKGVEPTSRNIADVNRDAMTLDSSYLSRFDVVFSNSFIEHLESREDQRAISRVIVGCGRPYFMQTPNKYSPIDPHFPSPCVPFFALYPKRVQARLLTWADFGSGWGCRSMEEALRGLTGYNPLGVSDVRSLFPTAEIVVERPMGVPMSIVAFAK